MKKFPRSFYQRPAIELARDLIGKVLVRRVAGETFRARIVETEAYVGTHDLACHAAKGRTRRTEVMFGPGGHAYVYFIYGVHDMFNIVASVTDDAQAVLVRAAEPMDGWEADLSGPGKFARRMRITRALNGVDLTGDELFLTGDGRAAPRLATGPRVGVDYAGQWAAAPLRFVDADSRAVSRPWPAEMRGQRSRPSSDDGGRRLRGEPGCPQPGGTGRGRPGSS
jgi:DNA-3-methyladenine glycosylase